MISISINISIIIRRRVYHSDAIKKKKELSLLSVRSQLLDFVHQEKLFVVFLLLSLLSSSPPLSLVVAASSATSSPSLTASASPSLTASASPSLTASASPSLTASASPSLGVIPSSALLGLRDVFFLDSKRQLSPVFDQND
jgi:hypothetical protein